MLPLLKTAYLLAVNLVLSDFWSINAYCEKQIHLSQFLVINNSILLHKS